MVKLLSAEVDVDVDDVVAVVHLVYEACLRITAAAALLSGCIIIKREFMTL